MDFLKIFYDDGNVLFVFDVRKTIQRQHPALRFLQAETRLTVYRLLAMLARGYLLPETSENQFSQKVDAESLILLQIRKVDPMKYTWLEVCRNPII